MKNQVLNLDEVRISEIVSLIGGFCGEQAKFFKYGTDHFTAFKVLRKMGELRRVAERVGYIYNTRPVPDELVKTIQKFLIPKRVADDSIRACMSSIPGHNYLTKYTLEDPDKLKEEFEKFMTAVVKHVNTKNKQYGVTLIRRRPVKASKTKTTNTNT